MLLNKNQPEKTQQAGIKFSARMNENAYGMMLVERVSGDGAGVCMIMGLRVSGCGRLYDDGGESSQV